MFCLSKPNQDTIRAFLAAQKNQPFSYTEIGSSVGRAPAGYTTDHNRVQLGTGAKVFELAKIAVQQWKMFDFPWVNLCWPDIPIEAGNTVAVLVSHLGFWSLNACRIVYVVDEQGVWERYGFAYGTLREHGEFGEERFTVEYNPADDTVWYDILAFSRPRLIARIAYPFARALQRRFARDSKAAMQRAVQGS
jgi:uncharacterized protein (UPF0548 family)